MSSKSYKLRGLVVALAGLLPKHYTYNQIADFFYRGGIIDKPEKPWPGYDGNKSDYVKDRMGAITGGEDFFAHTLPEIFGQIDSEYVQAETSEVVRLCRELGYTVETKYFEDPAMGIDVEWRELSPPADIGSGEVVGLTEGHIDTEGLPTYLSSLVAQLNSNLSQKNYDASALLIRRVIFVSCVATLKKANRSHAALDKQGDYKDLSILLSLVCQSVPSISKQLVARMRIAKWMGDDANHVDSWKAKETEVEMVVATLSQFLRILFPPLSA